MGKTVCKFCLKKTFKGKRQKTEQLRVKDSREFFRSYLEKVLGALSHEEPATDGLWCRSGV